MRHFDLGARQRGRRRPSLVWGALLAVAAPLADAALDPAGDPDAAFDGDGSVTTNIGQRAAFSDANAILVQPDGRIVVAGGYYEGINQHFSLTRYLADGAVDGSFGAGGEVKTVITANEFFYDVERQSDGRLIGVGVTTETNFDMMAVRYLADGALDTSWGTGGYRRLAISTTPGGGQEQAQGSTLDAAGRLILVGTVDVGATVGANRDLGVVRLTGTGDVDTTFGGGDGHVVMPVSPSSSDIGYDVLVQPDGKIVVGGRTTGGPSSAFVVRLLADGTPDSSFSGDGVAMLDFGGSSGRCNALALDASGRILCAGTVVPGSGKFELVLARFTGAGALDTTFDGDGLASVSIIGAAGQASGLAVAVQSSGRIVVSGRADSDNSGNFRFFAAGFTATGALDGGFGDGADGKLVIDPSGQGFPSDGVAGALQSDDRYLIAGYSYPSSNTTAPRIAIARLTTAGLLDPSFDGDGITFRQLLGGTMEQAYGIAAQADGKVLVAGYTEDDVQADFVVARYTTSGALDAGFDGDGLARGGVVTDNETARAVLVQSDGRIVLAGESVDDTGTVPAPAPTFAVMRFTAAGAIDTTFDGDGIAKASVGAGGAVAGGALLQPDGRIVVAGSTSDSGGTNADIAVLRFTAAGALDTSFDGDGRRRIDVSGRIDNGLGVARQADGKLLVVGHSFPFVVGANQDALLIRLNADGSLDTSFSGDGIVLQSFGPGTARRDLFEAVVAMPDGTLIAAGKRVDPRSAFVLARYLADGTLDTRWGSGGLRTFNVRSSSADSPYALVAQYDEKVVAVGESLDGGAFDFAFARFNWDDGSVDATFGTAGSTVLAVTPGADVAYGAALLSGGALLAGGTGQGSDLAAARLLGDPAPILPGAPDLDPASDSGPSSSDDYTNDATPTFAGSCNVGETQFLRIDGAIPTPRLRHLCRSGTYAITPAALADGTYAFRAFSRNAFGDTPDTGALSVTIDTVALPPTIASPTDGALLAFPPSPTIAGVGAEPGAQVAVSAGATPVCEATADGGGAWSCASALSPGSYTLTARQTDRAGNLSAPSVAVDFQLKIPTVTTVASDVSPSVYGQPVVFTATVASGESAPDGSVEFVIDGSVVATVAATPVDATRSSATFTTAALAVGAHPVIARYLGSATFYASEDALDAEQVVLKADSALAVSASANPSVFGQPVTFTVVASASAPGAGTPSGGVTLDLGGTAIPLTLDGSGRASYTTSALAVGGHAVGASYAGDGNFNGSVAPTISQIVDPANVTVVVASSANPSARGDSVTFTATVDASAPGAGLPTGAVSWLIDGVPQAGVLSAGAASLAIDTLAVGTRSIVVEYAGDGNFRPGSGALAGGQVVNPGASTTTLAVTPNPAPLGATVTMTATVAPVAPASDTPGGTVNFVIDGTPNTVTLVAGEAVYTTASLASGPHTVVAEYAGDGTLAASSDALVGGLAVDRGTVTVTVTSDADPSVLGQPVTFTATVVPLPPASAVPTGNAIVVIDGAPQTPVALVDGVATFTTAALTVGPHTVSVDYVGDANFQSAGGTLAGGQDVGPAATAVALSASPSPSTLGESATFTAAVTAVPPGSGTPDGDVAFRIDGGAPQTVALVGGVATLSLATLTAGPHTVTASYGGSSGFQPSSGELAGGHTVQRVAAQVAVSADPPVSVTGQIVTFTATVSATPPASGTPSGTVAFVIDGGTPVTVPLAGGVASLARGDLAVGNHTVVADYAGDAEFSAASATLAVPHGVMPAATTTVLSGPGAATVFGEPATFTAVVAAVAPGGGTPSGTVRFLVDGGAATEVPMVGGSASFVPTTLAVGTRDVVASYLGDAGYQSSASPPVTHAVAPTTTVLNVTASAASTVVGEPVTFTADVAPVAPGAGTPTGSVGFTVDGGAPVSAPLAAGRASLTLSTLAVGPHSVAVDYGGDGTHGAATGTLAGGHSVARAATAATVTSSTNPSAPGEAVTFTATVSAVAPGAGIPSGMLRFAVDGLDVGAVTLAGGQASLSVPALAVGVRAVTVDYAGDASFLPTAGALVGGQTVSPSASTTTLASAPNPSRFGQPVTFTATVSPTVPSNPTPTGTVTFLVDDVPIGSAPLVGGVATLTDAGLAVGSRRVRADFSGDAEAGPSSGTLDQHVDPAASAVSVAASPASSVTGQAVTFTATVAAVPPGAGTPSGAVRFVIDGGAPQTVTLVDASASLVRTDLGPGPHAVSVEYPGDPHFAAASGSLAGGHDVGAADTATTIGSSANPAGSGQAVTFTATVSSRAPGAGTPDGEVAFVVDGGAPVAVPLIGGSASLVRADLAVGDHTVRADYLGSAAYAPSRGELAGGQRIVAGTPAHVAWADGDGQRATIGTGFAVPLVVEVRDAAGIPLPGIAVRFASPPDGASASFAAAAPAKAAVETVTDAAGRARVTATANRVAGRYAITATVGPLVATASLTNLPGPPAGIAVASGSGQSAPPGAPFAAPLVVRVVDAGGNPVADAVVTFTGPATGAGAALSAISARTDAQGFARVSATANGQIGSYAIRATVDGVAAAASFALTNAAATPVPADGVGALLLLAVALLAIGGRVRRVRRAPPGRST